MHYAIRYYNGNPNFIKSMDEVILIYDEPHPALPEIIQEYNEECRIIIDYSKMNNLDSLNEDLDIFKEAIANHPNFAVILNFDQIEIIGELEAYDIDFMFFEPVGTWDGLHGVLSMGVSDVRICNELCFSIDKVSTICKKNDTKIRLYPNVAQSSSSIGDINPITKFFIRPEDLILYENVVDVIEFWGPVDRQQTLYKIYSDGKWPDNLGTLILDLNKDINNTTIFPNFGVYRMSCGKRCSYGKCNLCNRIYDLSDTINTALIEHEKIENS